MWEGLPRHGLRLEVAAGEGGKRFGFHNLLRVLRVPGQLAGSVQGAPSTVVSLAVQPWAVRMEEGDAGVRVLLHQLQGCSQLSCKALAHCFRARAERLNQEVIRLAEPDVNSTHWLVGERPNGKLLSQAVVERAFQAPCPQKRRGFWQHEG